MYCRHLGCCSLGYQYEESAGFAISNLGFSAYSGDASLHVVPTLGNPTKPLELRV